MPAPSVIEVLLSFRQVGAFVSDADRASTATTKVGTSAEKAGKSASLGAKGLLKYAAGATAIYGAVRFINHAITATEDLAKSTYALQQQAGMDAVTASEWTAANQERGISAKQFSVSLQTLSKQMEKARGGDAAAAQKVAEYRKQIDLLASAGGVGAAKAMDKLSTKIASAQASGDKAKAVMQQLGVPLADLRKGDTQDVMLRVADAFQKMKNPATRATDAQLLFGRSGRMLIPVLSKGREGVLKYLDAQKEAGNYLTEKQVKANLAAIKQQKELSAALHGLETQLSLALLPVLIAIGRAVMWFAKLLSPITSHANRLKVVIYGLVGAFLAYKAALLLAYLWTLYTNRATIVFNLTLKVLRIQTLLAAAAQKIAAVASRAWAIATFLLGAAMDALPIIAIVAGVIALGAAIYFAYKRVGWFHDAVDAAWSGIIAGARWVWNWLKANWPYLVGVMLGPFGIIAAAIYKHFGLIKKYALAVVNAVRVAIRSLVSWVETLPGKLGGILKKIPGVGFAMKAGGAVGGALHKAFGQYGGMVQKPGGFVVGERGPELVSLPAGALVRPTPDTASLGGGGRDLVIRVPVLLDRKVVAQAVARVGADQLARR